MTLEEAIKTSIEYETRVRDVYKDAVAKTNDPTGRKMLQILCDDEQTHVDYLKSRLEEWTRKGKITVARLDTTIPSREKIQKGVQKLERRMSDKDFGVEVELLKKARDVEVETSNFYKKMVATISDEGKVMFSRFVEIEDGHTAIVQAELDYLTGTGTWFDVMEFGMEHQP